jgi:hypothetical protein
VLVLGGVETRIEDVTAGAIERRLTLRQLYTGAALGDFRDQALARLAAQHEEIVRLRGVADASARVVRLPTSRRQQSDHAADTDDHSSLACLDDHSD